MQQILYLLILKKNTKIYIVFNKIISFGFFSLVVAFNQNILHFDQKEDNVSGCHVTKVNLVYGNIFLALNSLHKTQTMVQNDKFSQLYSKLTCTSASLRAEPSNPCKEDVEKHQAQLHGHNFMDL